MNKIFGPISDKICRCCMIGRRKQEISQTPTIRSKVFLNLLHFDLEESLPRTLQRFWYFLLVKDYVTALIFLKTLCFKVKIFQELFHLETFLELQSGKRWRREKFDNLKFVLSFHFFIFIMIS